MSTDQPGPGSPDDPFGKRPGDGGGPAPGEGGAYGDGPYGAPPPGRGGPSGPGDEGPYDQGPYGQGPYGQGPYDQDPYGRNPYGGGPHGPGRDPLAGMPPPAAAGKRVIARIIDVIIVLIPAYLLDWGISTAQNGSASLGRSAVGGVFAAGLGYVYEFYTTRASGQTIGKKAMGIRVAMLADGNVPTPAASGLRAGVLWVPVFFCSGIWFLIIGLTVIFDRPYRQGIEDRLAKTVVVEAA